MAANNYHPIQPITDIFKALFPQESITYTFKGAYKGLIKEKNTRLGGFYSHLRGVTELFPKIYPDTITILQNPNTWN